MEEYKRRFWYNLILSCIFIAIFMISFFILNNLFDIDIMNITTSFISQSKENISNFIEVCIGIYIAVISILASQRTSLTIKISEKRYDAKFVTSICNGLIFNLISIAYLSVFRIDSLNKFTFSASLILLSVFHFIRFLFYLVLMFSYNMSVIAIENEQEEKYKNDLLSEVEEIRKTLKEHDSK